MMRAAGLLLLAFLFSGFAAAQGQRQGYTITDLGPLLPSAINTWGQVAGNLNGHAYLWTRKAGLRDLGVLPGGTISVAAAINDLEQIVGGGDQPAVNCDGGLLPQASAFLWTEAGGMVSLGTVGEGGFPACAFTSYATGINFHNQVVGTNGNPSTTYIDGFSWTSTTSMSILPTIYQGHANGINNPGQIVGDYGFLDSNSMHASFWDQNILTDLGALGVPDPNGILFSQFCSGANAISDLGQVVGWSTPPPQVSGCQNAGFVIHAFLKSPNHPMRDLGTLPGDTSSLAWKVNLFGTVIGTSGSAPTVSYGNMTLNGRPFIWKRTTGMKDLNTLLRPSSGWVLNSAADINIWGQIVGTGTIGGQAHGFLLTPNFLVKK